MDKETWLSTLRSIRAAGKRLDAELHIHREGPLLKGVYEEQQECSGVLKRVQDARQQLVELQSLVSAAEGQANAALIAALSDRISTFTRLLNDIKQQQRADYGSLLQQEHQLLEELSVLELALGDQHIQQQEQISSQTTPGRPSTPSHGYPDAVSPRSSACRHQGQPDSGYGSSSTADCVCRSPDTTRRPGSPAKGPCATHSSPGWPSPTTASSSRHSSTGLPPEVQAYDAYVARHGITGGWHPDDHKTFMDVLKAHRSAREVAQQQEQRLLPSCGPCRRAGPINTAHSGSSLCCLVPCPARASELYEWMGHAHNGTAQKWGSLSKDPAQCGFLALTVALCCQQCLRNIHTRHHCNVRTLLLPLVFQGDYHAALAAAVDVLPLHTRQAVIAHCRWHADLCELEMRKRIALVNWRAAKDAAKAAFRAQAAALGDAGSSGNDELPSNHPPPDQQQKEVRQLKQQLLQQWKAEQQAAREAAAAAAMEQRRLQQEQERQQRQQRQEALKKQLEAARAAKQQQEAAAAAAATAQQSPPVSDPDQKQRLKQRSAAALERQRQLLAAKQERQAAKERAQQQLLAATQGMRPQVDRDPSRLLSATTAAAARAAAAAAAAAEAREAAAKSSRGQAAGGFVLHVGHKATPSWAAGVQGL